MELEGENKFFREDKNMSEISSNSALNSYAADYSYRTEHNKKTDSNKKADVTKEADKTTKKSKVSGRTIGDPVLSDKAQKYYEKLKAKYSNMDFILVSPEKKEEAESKKGMYQSSKELLVLIDSYGKIIECHFHDITAHFCRVVCIVGKCLCICDHNKDLVIFTGILKFNSPL